MVNYFSSLMPHFCSILLPSKGDDHTLTLTRTHTTMRVLRPTNTHTRTQAQFLVRRAEKGRFYFLHQKLQKFFRELYGRFTTFTEFMTFELPEFFPAKFVIRYEGCTFRTKYHFGDDNWWLESGNLLLVYANFVSELNHRSIEGV